MPIYEYECNKTGERFEKMQSLAFAEVNQVRCELHKEGLRIITGHLATRVWSVPANICIGKPTRIFENKFTGETRVAASEYDKPPDGYTVRELKNPIERSQFEREEQVKLDMTNAIVTANLEAQRIATKNNRHADITAHLSSLASDSDNPSGAETLIKAAMKRDKVKKNPRRSEVKLAVNHTDASNLVDAK